MKLFRFLLVILTIIYITVVAVVWFSFIRPYDFSTTTTFKTTPSFLYELLHSTVLSKKGEEIELVKEEKYKHLVYLLKHPKDGDIQFDWKIEYKNDSTSLAHVEVKNKDLAIFQRIYQWLSATKYRKNVTAYLSDIDQTIFDFLKNSRTFVAGVAQTPEYYCVCAQGNSTYSNRANTMLELDNRIMKFLYDFNIKKQGFPILEVQDWDIDSEKILINFCVPVAKDTRLPEYVPFFIKKFHPQKSLKAIHYGAYEFSGQAWFLLRDYAERKKIKIENEPLEIFSNDLQNDEDPKSVKTDIYMKIQGL